MRVSDFVKFIRARERHRLWKEQGRKKLPSNADPIIAKYRFCNVRRNDDRVTVWIHEQYLERWRDHPELWFALVVARLFNNESTLAAIQDKVLPFNIMKMRRTLHARRDAGEKNFNAAYIVSTNGRAMDKVDYVLDLVLNPMWQTRKLITRDIRVGQLANVHMVLEQQNGLASFMAAQVIADLKYAHPDWWEDFHTFAASGPGSRRGLNRVMGFAVDTPFRESIFRGRLLDLRDQTNARLTGMEPLTAHDIQNCLCEFDKYERARLGEGEPKQLYKPADLPWSK